jgi:hypothetical protein
MTTATRRRIWPRSQVRHTAGPAMAVYLVPVHAPISTQTHCFAVHESHYMVLKQHVKGTHTNPEVRKPSKKQDLSVRKPSKKQDLSVRKPSKKQDLELRKKQDVSVRKKLWYTRTEEARTGLVIERSRTQKLSRNSSCASRPSEVRALPHPRKRCCFAGPVPGFSASGTPRWD